MASRGRPPKHGSSFDQLIKRQCQKAVATKSTVLGRWGSFTTVKAVSDLKRGATSTVNNDIRPKKFFKSRDLPVAQDVGFTDSAVTPIVPKPPVIPSRKAPAVQSEKLTNTSKEKPAQKFFTSRAVVEEPKPRRTATRGTRQNYAESSDDDDNPVPPKVISSTNNQGYVPKGKPFAMQQHSVAKGARNSEESEDSSSEEGDHGSPDEKCFVTSNSKSIQEPPTRLPSQKVMPTEKITSPVLLEDAPLKVPPLKLVFKPLDKPPTEKRSTRKTRHSSNTSENEETSSDTAQDCPPKSRSRTYDSRKKKTNLDEPPPKKVSREESLVTIQEEEAKNFSHDSNKWNANTGGEDDLQKVTSQKNGIDFFADSSHGRDFSIEALTKVTPPETKISKLDETLRSYPEKTRTFTKSDQIEELEEKISPVIDLKPPVPEPKPSSSSTSEILTFDESYKESKPEQLKTDLPESAQQPGQKRTIFKTKSVGNSGNGTKKGLLLYKHKWNPHSEADDLRNAEPKRPVVAAPSAFDDDFDDLPSFSSTRATSDTSKKPASNDGPKGANSVKVPKADKDFFTVIKNVKKAHQIQDSGEFQELNDDVDYILGGLGANNSVSTRCLSIVTLASKCMEAPFRMHLRAHGTVTQFFAELKDAPQNPSLALCTSTVLFVLSQDRLNMDLDRDSLELMLNLLDTESRIKDALDGSGMDKRELDKNKKKVVELCCEMKKKGHAANLSLDHISADHLSMETLLSLTSKRAGEWFKEELRELGGLDHLVKTMADCVNFLTAEDISNWTEHQHNKLKKSARILKVLESVTSENEENCTYLLKYNNGQFLDLIYLLFKLLDEEVPLNANLDVNDRESVSHTLRDALFDVIRVFINLVHDYNSYQSPLGSELACTKPGLLDLVLHCLFVLPDSLPIEKRFDVLVLTLTLIINLVEHSQKNRQRLMKAMVPQTTNELFTAVEQKTAPEGFVQLFIVNEANARTEENSTDEILDGVSNENKNKNPNKAKKDDIEQTVAQLLNKAGKHMENTLIASYITLIVGYLVLEDKDNEQIIRDLLPDKNFSTMAAVLKKFFNFMNLTASSTVASNRGIKATEKILKHLEKIDTKPDPRAELKSNEDFDDFTLFDVSNEDEDTTLQNHSDDSLSNFGDNFGKM